METVELYNKDCIKVLDDIISHRGWVDCIITDPPYLQNYSSHTKNKNNKPIKNDNNFELIKEYIEKCYLILKDNGAMYIFCNSNHIDYFKQEMERVGFKIKNIIIWVKNNWSAGDLQASYGHQYEMIIYANKGRCFLQGHRYSDVWYAPRITYKNQYHQNQKPIEIIERCIIESTKINDIVFDGFMGSGTVGVACIKAGRKFIGCEIDEKYFRIAEDRIKKEKENNK